MPCHLPQCRVSWETPKDLTEPSEIPEDAEWKHWPVDQAIKTRLSGRAKCKIVPDIEDWLMRLFVLLQEIKA